MGRRCAPALGCHLSQTGRNSAFLTHQFSQPETADQWGICPALASRQKEANVRKFKLSPGFQKFDEKSTHIALNTQGGGKSTKWYAKNSGSVSERNRMYPLAS